MPFAATSRSAGDLSLAAFDGVSCMIRRTSVPFPAQSRENRKPVPVRGSRMAQSRLSQPQPQRPASGSLGAHPVTFNELVSHYCRYELSPDQSEAQIEKAHSTITTYKRYLRKWALPR